MTTKSFLIKKSVPDPPARERCLPTGFVRSFLILIMAAAGVLAPPALTARNTRPSGAEISRAHAWARARFGISSKDGLPFSFIYGGRPSSELMKTWRVERLTRRLDDARTERIVKLGDRATGLLLTCRAVEYRDFPTIEWTVYCKNTGRDTTLILEDLRVLDVRVRSGRAGTDFILHHNLGSMTTPRDYCPLDTILSAGSAVRIGAAGGRPLNTDMPYFNLESGSQGLIIAIGWPAQWSSAFTRDAKDGLRITAGQERTHLRLFPGEEVRTPLVVLQFWEGGDAVRAQNIWRRWMIAHNLPRPGGKLLGPVFSAAAADLFPGLTCGQSDEISFLEGYARRGLTVDYWWRDAGWYPCKSDWWLTGTWEPDPLRYPGGLRAVADKAHSNGMKFIVWFEPERVTPGTWLYENHPEWLLGKDGDQKLLNLGNPAARMWVTGHIDTMIVEQGIDMYRQDFNIDPLPFWTSSDAEDRQGMTENLYVRGLLAYWDSLKARHPGMPFDNCASGGRRNDLEMMRRGIPLSKSDFAGGTASSQCQLYGIASWLPYFGAGLGMSEDPYVMRSNIAPWSAVCYDTRKDTLNYDLIRRFISEWRRLAPYFQGDYYPLAPYSLEENVWMAWQFDQPETGEGMVEAFRRSSCPDSTQVFKLEGLEPAAVYTLENIDRASFEKLTGRELMNRGIRLSVPACPGTAIIVYRKSR